jgi:hypothetical protein
LAVLVSSRLRVVGPRHASGTRQLPSKPGRPLPFILPRKSIGDIPPFPAVFAAPAAEPGKRCSVISALRPTRPGSPGRQRRRNATGLILAPAGPAAIRTSQRFFRSTIRRVGRRLQRLRLTHSSNQVRNQSKCRGGFSPPLLLFIPDRPDKMYRCFYFIRFRICSGGLPRPAPFAKHKLRFP